MTRIHEKKTFKIFFIFQVIGLILTISLGIYGLIEVNKSNTFNKNILETIYLAVHFIINFFLATLNFLAIKKESSVLLALRTSFNEKVMNIVSYVLLVISGILFVYFVLVLCKVDLYYFNFPLILVIDIVVVSYLVLICALTVIFYLKAYKKDDLLISKLNGGIL